MLDSVELIQKINPDWKRGAGSGIVLCFKQESALLVDTVYSKMIDAKFESVKGPWDAFWGQRYACIKDPDGNQIGRFKRVIIPGTCVLRLLIEALIIFSVSSMKLQRSKLERG